MHRMAYVDRIVDPLIDRIVAGLPAALIVGPRAVGKTTTARRRGASMLRLDRPEDANLVRLDADAAVAGRSEPLVIDEWQLAPDVLAAVKRAVDDDSRPGRFLMTGSAGADLDAAGWPATGRVVRVPMFGFTVRERQRHGTAPPFIDALVEGRGEIARASAAETVRDYVALALRSGFPEASALDDDVLRRLWLSSWVDQLVARDVQLGASGRDPVRVRRLLQAIAANTARVVSDATLYRAAAVTRVTGVAYDMLLETLFVTERLPAWSSNRLTRLAKAPKRHLIEPALVGPLLGVDVDGVLRDSDLLGGLLESFVVAQLRSELAVSAGNPQMFHLRQADGRHEVDLLIERADGALVAIEVKATTTPTSGDARHLHWLRDALGDRVRAAVLLHAGRHAVPLGDGVVGLPIAAIWS